MPTPSVPPVLLDVVDSVRSIDQARKAHKPNLGGANSGPAHAELHQRASSRTQARILAGDLPVHQAMAKLRDGAVLEHIISALVAGGADLYAHDRFGDNALHVAVREGNLAGVQLLLDLGMDPNSESAIGQRRPLSVVVEALRYPDSESQGDSAALHEIARVLISHGAHLRDAQSGRFAAFSAAPTLLLAAGGNDHGAQDDLHGLVELLLAAGAGVDVHEVGTGRQPLHYASMRGHWKAGLVLLRAGADVRAVDAGGFTPWDYAGRFAGQSHEMRAVIRAAEMRGLIQLQDGATEPALRLAAPPAPAAAAPRQAASLVTA